MSLLHTQAPSRRDVPRVPVLLPLVEVAISEEGCIEVLLEREPYAADRTLQRAGLRDVLADIAADLGTPVRVEVHETDGVTFTDIVTPRASAVPSEDLVEAAAVPVGEVSGAGFTPGEDVAVAVVVAHHVAGSDGTAQLRLPPALLAAHPGLVVLMGQTSGVVVVSGRSQ